jgi:DNA repair exonuclease SbcCD ATPase subunit
MKRTLLVTIILFFAGLVVYAQQAGGSSQPSSAQVKQTAQQSLTQGKTNFSQFQATLDSLKTQNEGNDDAATYRRLKAQIDELEARIKKEQAQMQTKLDQGSKLSSAVVNQIQLLIDRYEAALAELEKFIAS